MGQPFTDNLLQWNATINKRSMPWKGEKDPYRVWLSEVILQQTRVEQGLSYYHRFIDAFPSISQLALAADEKVFKLWEGLGYYSRARNLLATARFIHFERNGIFPSTYEEILRLKGVGPYTAAAIASFAFNLPFAVIDGNVYRVLSRYFGINTPIDTPEGKKLYAQLANSLLDFNDPGTYNQAIMDFGATVCKPLQPLCSACPQNPDCQAFLGGFVKDLPVKAKTLQRKSRYFHYFILQWKDRFYVRQRLSSDIWKNLHEWFLLETPEALDGDEELLQSELEKAVGTIQGKITLVSPPSRQQLSHQTIHGRFIHVLLDAPLQLPKDYRLVHRKALSVLAFPRIITRYLETDPGAMGDG